MQPVSSGLQATTSWIIEKWMVSLLVDLMAASILMTQTMQASSHALQLLTSKLSTITIVMWFHLLTSLSFRPRQLFPEPLLTLIPTQHFPLGPWRTNSDKGSSLEELLAKLVHQQLVYFQVVRLVALTCRTFSLTISTTTEEAKRIVGGSLRPPSLVLTPLVRPRKKTLVSKEPGAMLPTKVFSIMITTSHLSSRDGPHKPSMILIINGRGWIAQARTHLRYKR